MKTLLISYILVLILGCTLESDYEYLYKNKCVQTNENRMHYDPVIKIIKFQYKYFCDGQKEYWSTLNSKQN